MQKFLVIGAWLAGAAALLPAVSTAQGLDLKVEMKPGPRPDAPLLCNVNIFKRVPSKGEAERFVQVAMQMCIRSEPSKDIAAQLMQNGHPVDASIFAGRLFYDHKSRNVLHQTVVRRAPDAKAKHQGPFRPK
jgi:hypothetical protein